MEGITSKHLPCSVFSFCANLCFRPADSFSPDVFSSWFSSNSVFSLCRCKQIPNSESAHGDEAHGVMEEGAAYFRHVKVSGTRNLSLWNKLCVELITDRIRKLDRICPQIRWLKRQNPTWTKTGTVAPLLSALVLLLCAGSGGDGDGGLDRVG